MNIYEKLLNITNEIGIINKNMTVGEGKNAYKAVREGDVLKAVKELELKYKVYSYPLKREIVDRAILETEKEFKGEITRSTKQFMRLEITYRFVNIEKPDEFIDIISYGDGIDSQDKAPGKAMTYGDKYALLKAYKIETGDDPDKETSGENNWKREEPKKIGTREIDILKKTIQKYNVSEETLEKILAKYNYTHLEDITMDNYAKIGNEMSK